MAIEKPLISNPAKEILRSGGCVFGFNVFESLRPSVIKVVAQTGYNMLFVETEHILHDQQNLASFLMMARDNGLSPVVTIPEVSRTHVSRTLDAGALGICLSHAETAEQVEELVRWMKYPLVGERALAHGPNADYRMTDAERYCQEANDSTMVILKIESHKGVENAKAMLANEWVDAVVFGPGDLAADMGLHGGWDHPEVVAAMESVAELAVAQGKFVEAPIYAKDKSDFERLKKRGIRIFGPLRSSEYDHLRSAAMQLMEPFI